MGKKPKNLAETRDRIRRDKERRDKRRYVYEKKFRKLVGTFEFAVYADDISARIDTFRATMQMLNERRKVYEKGIRRFFTDLIYNKIAYARRRLVARFRRLELVYDLFKGYIPITAVFTGHKIDLYVDEKVEEFLSSPEYVEATRDVLAIIFSDILRHRYLIRMRPEDLERLKGIIAFMYERYFAPFRDKPCSESKYIAKLTPLTLWVFKNQPVRFYVVRYIKVDALRNPHTVMVAKPIDVMLSDIRVRKPRGEKVALTIIGGDTSLLTGHEDIALSRNENREPRRLLKSYVSTVLTHRVRDAFARQLGVRDKVTDVGHCSVYIGLNYDKTYKRDKYIEYWYKRRYRGIMAW